MELKDLQEIIDRNGLGLKQQVGLALSEQGAKDIIKAAVSEVFSLHLVSKCYTEKDMDNAYDKGFKDGNQRDLTGSLIEVL